MVGIEENVEVVEMAEWVEVVMPAAQQAAPPADVCSVCGAPWRAYPDTWHCNWCGSN